MGESCEYIDGEAQGLARWLQGAGWVAEMGGGIFSSASVCRKAVVLVKCQAAKHWFPRTINQWILLLILLWLEAGAYDATPITTKICGFFTKCWGIVHSKISGGNFNALWLLHVIWIWLFLIYSLKKSSIWWHWKPSRVLCLLIANRLSFNKTLATYIKISRERHLDGSCCHRPTAFLPFFF